MYPLGKADLYAAFLLRGLELVREGGVSAMLTLRNWMFLQQYAGLREHLLGTHGLATLGDFDRGAFESVPDEVVSVTASIFVRSARTFESKALCPTPREDKSRDAGRTQRKRAATLSHEGRHTFDPAALKIVPEWPLVYWWTADFLDLYAATPKLGEVSPARSGAQTSDITRFLRYPWEVNQSTIEIIARQEQRTTPRRWAPYVAGAKGVRWIDPLSTIVDWGQAGLQVRTFNEYLYGSHTRTVKNEDLYWKPGVAFTTIGNAFSARLHHSREIFGAKGASVFPENEDDRFRVLCLLNSSLAQRTATSLNPGIDFTIGDINRLPVVDIANAVDIGQRLIDEFARHEAACETSHAFRYPGPSPMPFR